jgi:hypothetical protein
VQLLGVALVLVGIVVATASGTASRRRQINAAQ